MGSVRLYICCGYFNPLSKQTLWSYFMFVLSGVSFLTHFFPFSHSIKAIISFMQCSLVCCNIFSSPFFILWLCWSAFVLFICYIRITIENIFGSVFREFFGSYSPISCYILYFRIYFICIYCLFVWFTIQIVHCTVYRYILNTDTKHGIQFGFSLSPTTQ